MIEVEGYFGEREDVRMGRGEECTWKVGGVSAVEFCLLGKAGAIG